MTPVVDLRRFELVLGRILEAGLEDVSVRWGNNTYPRPTFPYVELSYVAGPTEAAQPRVGVHRLPTRVRVTVLDASDQERVLDVNGVRYRSVEASNEAHRDAFLVQLADAFDYVAAIGIGETELEIFETQSGGLWRVRAPLPGLQVVTVETADMLIRSVSCQVTVGLSAFSKSGRRPSAAEILSTAMFVLAGDEARNTMAAHEIGFSAPASSGTRDLSGIEGTEHEHQSQRDLEFTVEARQAQELVTSIDTAQIQRGAG